eukprot:gnl/MRDRNA2_/MRDRNA2_96075_c0_seq1.p2 gnl/MRDRNA2_/MRDRNA2_96075_c0~~gnl/MRDRNA2_/MRDRNA2_96075_c0_seq1.p2  ORF type:complete len:111 (+),score=21.33 gnl/MRDRNA2_/MRDRNA2_96075_c0_seq1:28-333(+)
MPLKPSLHTEVTQKCWQPTGIPNVPESRILSINGFGTPRVASSVRKGSKESIGKDGRRPSKEVRRPSKEESKLCANLLRTFKDKTKDDDVFSAEFRRRSFG